MSDWDPELYLQFEKERTQPAKDLLARLEKECPARVIDIGCGPGNSTLELQKRFPRAEITGLDSSPAMIEKAKGVSSAIHWVLGDASGDLSQLGRFDVVFSNAALQWMPDHGRLLPRLFSLLEDGGVLAVQVPLFDEMPASGVIKEVSSAEKWENYFSRFQSGMHRFSRSFYYDTLSGLSQVIRMWVTEYCHIMQGHAAIVSWLSSTVLRPCLDRLPESAHEMFLRDISGGLAQAYPAQADGRVIFPFRRLFFTAEKSKNEEPKAEKSAQK